MKLRKLKKKLEARQASYENSLGRPKGGQGLQANSEAFHKPGSMSGRK